MEIVLTALGVYLLLGIVSLFVLNLTTKRVQSRLRVATSEVQQFTGGGFIIALVVTILALWIFWPFAIYAAVASRRGGEK